MTAAQSAFTASWLSVSMFSMERKTEGAWGSSVHGACASGRRATDRKALHQQRRLAHASGHALPALAAHADAFVQRPVMADADHLGQRRRPVADQRRALDRQIGRAHV